MIDGKPPHSDQNSIRVLSLIATNGTPSVAYPGSLVPTFKDYLEKCLEVDPEKRWDAQQLLMVSLSGTELCNRPTK
jgi:serine/threonine protein kinase